MLELANCLPAGMVGPCGEFDQQMRVLGSHMAVSKRSGESLHHGEPYTRLWLGCVFGTMQAVIWHERFVDRTTCFSNGDVLRFKGVVKQRESVPYLTVSEFSWVDPSAMSFVALFPQAWAAQHSQTALAKIEAAWDAVETVGITDFLAELFLQVHVCQGFLNSQASVRHHHAYQGGLLDHVSDMVASEPCATYNAGPFNTDVAFALSMVHDIGKLKTLAGNQISERGRYQAHEVAALEILAEPLSTLERRNKKAANAIRGYFTPKALYPYPKSAIYAHVSHVDRLSAGGRHG